MSRGDGCWRCGENGYIHRDCKQIKDGEGKSKRRISRMSRSVMDSML